MDSSHLKLNSSKGNSSPFTKHISRQERQKQKSQQQGVPVFRLLLVWGILLLAMGGLAYRLYQLQVVQANRLQRMAKAQQSTSMQPYVPRRSIVDSQGNVLATDRLTYTLFVHPRYFEATKEITNPTDYIARELATILGDVTPEQLKEKFKEKESGIKLATGLNESQAVRIGALRMGGVDLEKQYSRYYPQDEMAADIVGYVDGEHQGQAGLELSQREILEREVETYAIRRTGKGVVLPDSLPDNLLQSNDWQLQLTIDMRLQRAARELLKAQVSQQKAKRGTVLVMDAQDGAILAMVNEPTFNPNEYYKARVEYFKNWAVSDLYEPGSTFKPVIVALAMNEGAVKPKDRLNDSGSIRVGPWTISNASKSGAGLITVTEAIRYSSNVVMVAIARRLKPERYYELLQEVGLDSRTGIDLPGEATNYLKPRQSFMDDPIEQATTSFGQGLSLTPIKLLQLNAMLANGGKLVTPHVVKGLVDARNHLHWQPDHPIKQVVKPEVAHSVVQMMESVVSGDGGTGKAALIPGYRVGGKTGTAQKAGPRGGYLANAKITSFVSVLPVDNPRYVVVAIIDEPKGANAYGGTVAAPVVKSVMEALIAIKGIPPSQAK
ncbi:MULTISPECIES: penicillin-binding protein 2 [unclassified Synechocystis]|uniref:peptidoglycan D,D-transpeptidase FtsI family protein n=1 Tax=unclassified Synechocystis TaxID=2640012 RepID=UPI0004007A65|nr:MULTISPECIES: penicillin-binding protein 2 [unclassified Synechocystis]AIE75282.1 Cell division protein FtsI [Peptidoglycan synthetase] [Synechocystis sp. PCC 6714]MCT0253024.1 penicillin-binding protein 2 [Synechocystis sp. CS-94]